MRRTCLVLLAFGALFIYGCSKEGTKVELPSIVPSVEVSVIGGGPLSAEEKEGVKVLDMNTLMIRLEYWFGEYRVYSSNERGQDKAVADSLAGRVEEEQLIPYLIRYYKVEDGLLRPEAEAKACRVIDLYWDARREAEQLENTLNKAPILREVVCWPL